MNKVKQTLLLVEDETIIAMSEKFQLEQYGYNVIIATDAEAAIAAVYDNPDIDLVLMDIDLGEGMDGTEAVRIILQTHNLPVVFLSSHTEPDVVQKTEDITSYGYIVKNSCITVVDASIKMAFRLFRAKQVLREKEQILLYKHEFMSYVIKYNRSAIAVHDRDLNYLYVSQRYLDAYQVKEVDVIGRHHYDVFPDLPQKWRDVHQQTLEGSIIKADNDPFVREDGTIDWSRWETKRLIRLKGRPNVDVRFSSIMYGTIRDIT
ncbi:MAG: response regulator [Spirochaetes bacterium]|jgi:CheY-like chemotaxis protein|nr:response regulator [Spirochaetota bacterium]